MQRQSLHSRLPRYNNLHRSLLRVVLQSFQLTESTILIVSLVDYRYLIPKTEKKLPLINSTIDSVTRRPTLLRISPGLKNCPLNGNVTIIAPVSSSSSFFLFPLLRILPWKRSSAVGPARGDIKKSQDSRLTKCVSPIRACRKSGEGEKISVCAGRRSAGRQVAPP